MDMHYVVILSQSSIVTLESSYLNQAINARHCQIPDILGRYLNSRSDLCSRVNIRIGSAL